MARIYQPRQRESDKRWDYTISSDEEGWAHPAGYCHEYKELSSSLGFPPETAEKHNMSIRPFRDKFHGSGHATAEEAVLCYRQYQLDHELKFYCQPQEEVDRLERCTFCREFTAGYAFLGNIHNWPLCIKHQTREIVEGILKKAT